MAALPVAPGQPRGHARSRAPGSSLWKEKEQPRRLEFTPKSDFSQQKVGIAGKKASASSLLKETILRCDPYSVS